MGYTKTREVYISVALEHERYIYGRRGSLPPLLLFPRQPLLPPRRLPGHTYIYGLQRYIYIYGLHLDMRGIYIGDTWTRRVYIWVTLGHEKHIHLGQEG